MAPLTPDERRALLALQLLPGVGPVTIRRLRAVYGGYRAALERATAEELGAKAALARGSRRVEGRLARAVRTLDRLGAVVLTEEDDAYPERLRHLHQPPPALYCRGRLELLERPCVAVIGARNHTHYGADVARELADGLARAGVAVVSGFARGIDGIAHRAALAAGGDTIAVLGSGCDVPYPPEHDRLLVEIATRGLVVTEFPPGEPPFRSNFPRRNRLIAALAHGIVVVEAGPESGSLITVDHALDLGREVFAVPGPITRHTSAGTNAMLRDGAAIVLGVEDILAGLAKAGFELPRAPRALAARSGDGGVRSGAADAEGAPPPGLSPEAARIWRALSPDPLPAEAIAAAAGVDAPVALGALLDLELAGCARQLPGRRYVRC